jgi:hypothetical protein
VTEHPANVPQKRVAAICSVCGIFTTIDFPGATSTFPSANNPEGDIVGAYLDTVGTFHGFLLRKGVFESIDITGALSTQAIGINPAGAIVGFYLDSAVVDHGFIRTP